MQAIIAHEHTAAMYRLSEDYDSTPTATWVEHWNGKRWHWEVATTQPFAEVLTEYSEKGFVCLAVEE